MLRLALGAITVAALVSNYYVFCSFLQRSATVKASSTAAALPALDVNNTSDLHTNSSHAVTIRSAGNRGRLHSTFPTVCGQLPNDVRPALSNIMDLIEHDPETVPKHNIKFNTLGHGKYTNEERFKSQVCLYDVLTRWNELAEQLGITQWAAHGGSAMGAKCYGGMNPWDDDIDMHVLDCTALNDLYASGDSNISHHYPALDPNSHSMKNSAAIWDSRLISNDLILSKGSRCCKWYKLLTVQQAFMWRPGGNIMGIDVECMDRGLSSREAATQTQSGWKAHMKARKYLHTVVFGPTTIQLPPPQIVDDYILLRYGKHSPCQFPLGSGRGAEPEHFDPRTATNQTMSFYHTKTRADVNFALDHWYVPKSRRNNWMQQAGNGNQMALTEQIPNLNKVEIDNSISPGCAWGPNSTIKVIGWNAERGTYWDRFYSLIREQEELKEPFVILMNEMDIGMARSGNVHTARRLALQLRMNYAYGVEFLELTRGTKAEQEATKGKRDALSLHGNAILSKCILGDAMILRDPLPRTYFSKHAHKGINADGFEVRLGGRMGLFARIFQRPSSDILASRPPSEQANYHYLGKLPAHFVVGNVHKLSETERTHVILWDYYGFGTPPRNSTKYDGRGTNMPASQQGVIIQGDFGPTFCSLGGLGKMNNHKIHKTFPSLCLPNGKSKLGPIAGDFFCSNMKAVRSVIVTPPCDRRNHTHPLTLADHAIVSIEVQGEKNLQE